jgi:hypothetical protein
MDEAPKTQSLNERKPIDPQRRPWHAPQYFLAGLASTLAQQQAGSDGHVGPPNLS